jgi:hypothetical protein
LRGAAHDAYHISLWGIADAQFGARQEMIDDHHGLLDEARIQG